MNLTGKRVAVLVEQKYEELEVWYPVYRLREAGCAVTLVGPAGPVMRKSSVHAWAKEPNDVPVWLTNSVEVSMRVNGDTRPAVARPALLRFIATAE